MPWQREQLQRGPRDDAKGALTPDHELGEVVTRGVLEGVRASLNDSTIGEHHLEIQDPVFCDAILHSPGTAAVFCQVAANGASPS